jgi:hypothetical protein
MWIIFHRKELCDLYILASTVTLKWPEHVTHVNKTRNACRILVGKLLRNQVFERPRSGAIILDYISVK